MPEHHECRAHGSAAVLATRDPYATHAASVTLEHLASDASRSRLERVQLAAVRERRRSRR